MSVDLDSLYKELAHRAIIHEIAEPGTLLIKKKSPGRLYESISANQLMSAPVVEEARPEDNEFESELKIEMTLEENSCGHLDVVWESGLETCST